MNENKLRVTRKDIHDIVEKAIAIGVENLEEVDITATRVMDGIWNIIQRLQDQRVPEFDIMADILDIINSENSGLSAEQRLAEVERIINKKAYEWIKPKC